MAATDLKVVQLGTEVTWGTPVAATSRLMGVTDASITPERTTIRSEEKGLMVGSDLVTLAARSATGMWEQDLSFEDIMFVLAGLFGNPTTTGSADPWTHAYAAGVTSVVVPRLYTAEMASIGSAGYKLLGALVSEATISCELGNIWKLSANLIGKDFDVLAALASLSRRSVELIPAQRTNIYVDDLGGTLGTTIRSNVLRSFSLQITTGRHVKQLMGGINPGAWGDTKWEAQLTVTLEWNSYTESLVNTLSLTGGILPLSKYIRIEATGAVATGHRVRLDMPGTVMDNPTIWEDADGNMAVTLVFSGQNDPTFGNMLKAQVLNGISTAVPV